MTVRIDAQTTAAEPPDTVNDRAWATEPIRELCSAIIDCVNKTAPTVEGPTPYRMIRTTNVRLGKVDLSAVRYVEEAVYRRWVRRGEPQDGDIVLTREAPLGEVGMLRDPRGVFLGQRLIMYRADPDRVDRNFLLYAMRSPAVQSQIRAFGAGATVEHMRVPDCGELLIHHPELSEQRRIGSVLAAFDELIRLTERRIELLEQVARSLYREWFVRLRVPSREDVAQTSKGDDGTRQDGWADGRLADVTSVVTRGIAPRYAEDGSWTVLNQRCIRDERVIFRAARRQDRAVADAKRVRLGDVLINSTGVGTLGRVAQLREVADSVTVDSHVTIVRPKTTAIGDWLGLTLRARQAELAALGAGSTGQTELSRQAVEDLRLRVPDSDTLHRFSRAVAPFLNAVPELTRYIERLGAARDVLLPRLVTGRLDMSRIDLGPIMEDVSP